MSNPQANVHDLSSATLTILGPGWKIQPKNGTVKASFSDDKTKKKVGRSGDVTYSIRIADDGELEVTLESTDPANPALSALYEATKRAPGIIQIAYRFPGRGIVAASQCAFVKLPDFNGDEEPDDKVWRFHVTKLGIFHGGGLTPEQALAAVQAG